MEGSVTQKEQILTYLRTNKRGITQMEAIEFFGCTCLAARIADLRADGHRIISKMVKKNGKTYARYFLEEVS